MNVNDRLGPENINMFTKDHELKRKDSWFWLGMAPDLIAQILWISLFKA